MHFCGNCGARLAPEEAKPPAPSDFGSPPSTQTPPINEAPALPPSEQGRLGVVLTTPGLLDHFKQAGLEATGQRRSVTVLFVDLSGYTTLSEQLSDEVLYELLQKFIRVLVEDVYKYEGTVDKLTGDGLMALFGAPVAFENNAERALRSAMDMQADVARLSHEIADLQERELRVHIGLNAGSVIVGGLGTETLMNYTAIGDSVNLARRLEETAAPGEILVSDSVYRQARRLFDFELMASQSMKGISREIAIYRLVRQKNRPQALRGLDGLRAPMIGRENEMRLLAQAAHRLVRGRQGGVILLVGEAGIGKSRLTLELKAILDPGELRIVEGRSLTYRKAVAYWIFQDILRNLLSAWSDITPGELHQRLYDEVRFAFETEEQWQERLLYLEHLLALEPSDVEAAERIRYLDAGQLRQQIFLAVRDLFEAEAHVKPLLVILEDLHWADDASLGLLQFLLDSCRRTPLLFYIISRPFEGGVVQAISERARQRLAANFIFIRLQALPPEQCKELFYALLFVPDLPETLREGIISRAAGSPLYLEEILRMLIENNLIYRDVDHWSVTPGADLQNFGVPETLQDLILARFDRLDQTHRKALQTASVIGYQFNIAVLKAVLAPVSEPEVEAILAFLVEREFIQPDSDAGEEYTFKHVLTSDAVYSTLLQRDRRELHSRVAKSIEAIFTNRLDSQVELLANHYLRSPQLDRALHYLLLAGARAARDYANEQAREHYVQALALLPRVPYKLEQALEIHTGLGDALVTAGEYQAAREHYQAALEINEGQALKDDMWQRRQCGLLRKTGITFERQGDYDKALGRLSEAEALLGQTGSLDKGVLAAFSAERANIYNDMGWINSRRGRLDQAEVLLKKALRLAESSYQIDVVASILNRLGGICYQRDQLEQAAYYLGRSLELREKIGDIVNVARSYNNLGLLRGRQGNLEGALDCFNRSFKLQTDLGDVEGLIELHINMGLIEIDRGKLPSAESHFKDALASAEQIGHSYFVGYAHHHLALLYLYQENWEAVVLNGKKSQASFQQIGVQEHQVDSNTFLGLAYLALNDLPGAQAAAGAVIELLHNQKGLSRPGGEEEGRALRLLAGLARVYHDDATACRYLEKSILDFSRVGSQMESARSLLALAEMQAECKDLAAARESLKEASQIFEKAGNCFYDQKIAAIEKKML